MRVSYGIRFGSLAVCLFSTLLHFFQLAPLRGTTRTPLLLFILFIYFFVHRFFLTSVKHINQSSFKCSEIVVYGHDNFIIISFVRQRRRRPPHFSRPEYQRNGLAITTQTHVFNIVMYIVNKFNLLNTYVCVDGAALLAHSRHFSFERF